MRELPRPRDSGRMKGGVSKPPSPLGKIQVQVAGPWRARTTEMAEIGSPPSLNYIWYTFHSTLCLLRSLRRSHDVENHVRGLPRTILSVDTIISRRARATNEGCIKISNMGIGDQSSPVGEVMRNWKGTAAWAA